MTLNDSLKKHGITAKFLLWFLVVALLPPAFLGYASYSHSVRMVKETETQNLIDTADAKVERLEAYVAEREKRAATLAGAPRIADAMRILLPLLSKAGANSAEFRDADRQQRLFLTYWKQAMEVDDLMLLSREGEVVFSAMKRVEPGTSYRTGPRKDSVAGQVFDQAVTSRKTSAFRVECAPDSGQPVAFIASPTLDGGTVTGAVVVQVGLDEIYAIAQDTSGLGETGETVLASLKGDDAVCVCPLRHDAKAAFQRKIAMGSNEGLPIQKAVQGESGAGMSIDYRGHEVLAVWRYLPRLRWGLVVKEDSREVFHPVVALQRWALGVAGLTLLVVVLAALGAARSISRRIIRLTRATRQVAAGDLVSAVPVDSKDEIGTLAESFNKMRGDLYATLLARDREIAERTRAEEALASETERLAVTLRSIGDGVIATDTDGNVILINAVAEQLTGWSREAAFGQPLGDVFHIINELTREPCENPAEKVLRLGIVVGLANHTLLISRDGTERIIADSGAPIHAKDGHTLGVVLVFRDVTEKKRAEDALHRERDRAQQYLDIAGVILVAIGSDQRVTLINKKGCEALEFSAEEIIGQNWFDLMVPQEDRERTRAAFVQMMRGEVEPVEYFENAVITRFGTERLIAWHNTLLRDENGRIVGTLSSGEDITERKQAEAALHESESVLRSFFDSPGVQRGIVEVVDGDILHISDNAVAAAFFRRSPESMRGKFASELGVPEETVRMWVHHYEDSRRTGGPVTFEYSHQAGGKTRWLLPTVSCLGTGPAGHPRFAYVVRDITESKRAEESLRESEERFRVFMDNNPAIAWAKDEQGRHVYLNRTYETRFGVRLADWQGKTDFDLWPEDVARRFRQNDLDVLAGGQPIHVMEETPAPDGGRHYWWNVKFPFQDSSGKRYVGGFGIDMTEQQRAEEEIRTLNAELQHRLVELRDAQDQLVKRERLAVLGQLAGGVGHELRNPLGVIKNAAYFLNMSLENPSPQVKETLGILEAEVDTAEKIISSLLDYARPKPPISGTLHINEVIQAAVSRPAIPTNVNVVVQLDEKLPVIRGDSGQLLQVFTNLIANALQAMRNGGRLTVTSGMSGPDHIVVSVADTGVGIAPENLSKVFQPLFTTKTTGIGLGLAITRTLIEAHHGTIEVQSEIGKGTTFAVRLPVH